MYNRVDGYDLNKRLRPFLERNRALRKCCVQFGPWLELCSVDLEWAQRIGTYDMMIVKKIVAIACASDVVSRNVFEEEEAGLVDLAHTILLRL